METVIESDRPESDMAALRISAGSLLDEGHRAGIDSGIITVNDAFLVSRFALIRPFQSFPLQFEIH